MMRVHAVKNDMLLILDIIFSFTQITRSGHAVENGQHCE